MEQNYRREAIKLLRGSKWTYDMISKAFRVSKRDIIRIESTDDNTDKEELRKRIMNVLPLDLKKQIDYLSAYRKRNKTVIYEKASVIRRLRNEFPFSFPEIGLLLRRDHTTIMHHYSRNNL